MVVRSTVQMENSQFEPIPNLNCKIMISSFIFFFLTITIMVKAFKSPIISSHLLKKTNISPLHHSLNQDFITTLTTSLLQQVNSDQAKSEFFFFFFGGSGALGIGFAQIPKILQEYSYLSSLKESTNQDGKETLDANPLSLIGYPEPLAKEDISYIIDNLPSIEEIYNKGPKKSYLATKGCLEREGFFACFPTINKVALYAAYEAISQGGGELVAPDSVTPIITTWKTQGLDGFKQTLLTASLKKYAAYSVFVFLIALVLDLIVESGINAFL
jgi:hypothetical protein